ncbi:hypothetical protein SAMN05216360_10512 [Methylobacterium phyllostachyos]|uniref:Uncharacterized protein n=1 Tax=Methylobacterium phyllostachyos TaxID=582672 RepID=A0A1G9XS81_9HYPH|nr:hypothetical protein SAMN05216360_10512 [Methylobacterium phyllostachyos]
MAARQLSGAGQQHVEVAAPAPRSGEGAVIYVLVIMLAGSGSAIGSVVFNAEDGCEAAAKAIA